MTISKKKVLFAVQGEGRGHMTQSIALQNMMKNTNMELCEVLVGKSPQRQIPDFYAQKIQAPITNIDSPNFVTDSKMKSVKMLPSVLKNIFSFSKFSNSLKLIDEKIKQHKPDLIVNFYDPLIGLYYLTRRPNIPMVCVAHQYIYNHPDFEFPKGHVLDKNGLKWYTNLTAIGSVKRLAISFYPMSNYDSKNVAVIPPLLRDEVFEQSRENGNYLLVYLLNSGYMDEIIEWHKNNPDVELHCFVDKKDILDVWAYSNKLFFHKINDKKFLNMMGRARGLVSTAGFESVCEAMYLGKPVFMVPVEGHYEQFCNSRDAFKAGAGLYDSSFKISRFLNYLANYKENSNGFKDWVNSSKDITLAELNAIVN
jgi:uncharacterized protein (TIGR00661 family)